MFASLLLLRLLAASLAGDVPPGLGFSGAHGGEPFVYGTRRVLPGGAFVPPQVAAARLHVPASGVVYGGPRGPGGFHYPSPTVFAGAVPDAVPPPYAGLRIASVVGGRPALTGYVGTSVAKINTVPAIVKTVVAEPAYGPHPYSFGYDTVDEFGNKQYRHETSDANNSKKGSYGYTDANGIYRQVDYIADANGFRAIVRTNEPGTAPSAPAGVLYDAKPVDVKPATVVKAVVAAAPTNIHSAPSLVAGPTVTRIGGHPAAFRGRLVAKVVPGAFGHGPLLDGPVAPRPAAFLAGPVASGGYGPVNAALVAPLGRFQGGPGGFDGPVVAKFQARPTVVVSQHGPAFVGHPGLSGPAIFAAGPSLGKVHAAAGVHPDLHYARGSGAHFAGPHPHHVGPAIVKAR